jgi:hypothetical protein
LAGRVFGRKGVRGFDRNIAMANNFGKILISY